MASFIERIFGGGIPSERREAILAYLTEEWKLQGIQDAEGSRYNDVLTKYGGGATAGSEGMSEIVSAAKRQAEAYASLSRRHTALGPVPDEAGACYFRWEHTYLALAEWASAMAAAYEGFSAGATPHAGRLQELQRAEQKAERNARKEEVKLLNRIGAKVEDVRRLMKESGDAATGLETRRDTEEPLPTSPDLAPVLELGHAVVATALMATEPVNKEWGEVTGEAPMSPKSNYIVRMETVWFFLHVVNRTAFAIGGNDARAFIQDAIATSVVSSIVKSSYDISTAKEGFDAEQWQQRMINSAIEALNESELDYGACKKLAGESVLDESCAVGRFAARVAESIDQKDTVGLRLLVGGAAIEVMSKVELPKLVRRAIEAAH